MVPRGCGALPLPHRASPSPSGSRTVSMGRVGRLPALWWQAWGSEGVVGTPVCSWDWGCHLKPGSLVGQSRDLGVCSNSSASVRHGLGPRTPSLCRGRGTGRWGSLRLCLLP